MSKILGTHISDKDNSTRSRRKTDRKGEQNAHIPDGTAMLSFTRLKIIFLSDDSFLARIAFIELEDKIQP